MTHIGLDFGTTTSVLSYHDGQRIEAFKLGGASGTHYIPTVLAVENDDLEALDIGTVARLRLGEDDYEVYTHFKMLLAERDQTKLFKRGFNRLQPQQVAQAFIQHLIQRYQSDRNVAKIQRLVITVPEIWVREGRHAAREALKDICRDLELPVKMLSEPVAASLYFADRYQAQYNKPFDGHVLVCDYGGGTLDLSLSRIEGEQVTVLEGTGKGNASETLGIAGVAFDEAVVKRVLGGGEISRDRRYFRLLKDFEEQKIGQTESLARQLSQYRKHASINKKAFTLGDDIEVKAQDLAEEFDRLIAPELNKALQEMSTYLERHNLDVLNPESFRVVMVGGFSNFYLVREAVRKFFASRTESDRRFETCFSLEDTALAISKGAALYAGGAFEVNLTCPISVGVKAYRHFREEDVECLQKGIPIKNYVKPKFIESWFEIRNEKELNTEPFTIFLDIGNNKRRYLRLEGNLKTVLPNPSDDNEWQIGFSVDEDLIFTLFIQDKHNHTKKIELGNLEQKLNGLHIVEH